MFDTIILLTGVVEQPVLSALLLENNPFLTILSILTSTELGQIDPEILARARLIAFTTEVIVPGDVLARLGYGAYNFHAGPPEYPGWAPAHFALHDGAAEFGVTAHAMVEKVDAGAIVRVERFDIPPGADLAALEARAYAHLVRLFRGLSKRLATQAAPLRELPIRWGHRKNTRRSYLAICDIGLDIPDAKLRRRLMCSAAATSEYLRRADESARMPRLGIPRHRGAHVS